MMCRWNVPLPNNILESPTAFLQSGSTSLNTVVEYLDPHLDTDLKYSKALFIRTPLVPEVLSPVIA